MNHILAALITLRINKVAEMSYNIIINKKVYGYGVVAIA